MKNELIVGMLIGIGALGIVFGLLIQRFKLAGWIAGYDPNKHDSEKICKIVSSNVILYGIFLITYSIVNYLAYEWIKNTEIFTILNVLTIIFVFVKISYSTNKYARKNNNID